MEIIRKENGWEELTSHPEILKKIPRSGWGEHKNYCVAAIPGGNYVAQESEEIIGQPVIFAESQNLDLSQIEEHVLYLARCPHDDLGTDEVLLLGTKMNESPYKPLQNRLSRGDIYVSPDGKKFLVRGSRGDPYTASSMFFSPFSEKEVDNYISQKEEEKRAEEAAQEAEQRTGEERKEREYLQYRSSIRGLTEGLGISILRRENVATNMPPVHMVVKNMVDFPNDEYQMSFKEVASFCSPEGPYAFLRSIVKFVRQTNDGQIDREAWDSLNLDDALNFALEERERHERKKDITVVDGVVVSDDPVKETGMMF